MWVLVFIRSRKTVLIDSELVRCAEEFGTWSHMRVKESSTQREHNSEGRRGLKTAVNQGDQ
jgi:hypothetical protein